jgi:hypothetical protein
MSMVQRWRADEPAVGLAWRQFDGHELADAKNVNDDLAVRRALEAAGVIFIDEN